MVAFNRNDKRSGGGFSRGGSGFGGRPSFGGGKSFGGRDGGRPAMHQATCSECGASCELPFRPSGDRPVFCRACFAKQDGGGSRPARFEGGRNESFHSEDRQMHSATCDKCGKSCQVPFRPMAGKKVFCSECFEKGGSVKGSSDSGEVIEQIKRLSAKIDKLTEMLAQNRPVEKIEKPVEKSKEVVEEKPKAKVKAVAKKTSIKKKK